MTEERDTDTSPLPYPVGYVGYAWFLWCPDHGTFWADERTGRCGECGYQTHIQ